MALPCAKNSGTIMKCRKLSDGLDLIFCSGGSLGSVGSVVEGFPPLPTVGYGVGAPGGGKGMEGGAGGDGSGVLGGGTAGGGIGGVCGGKRGGVGLGGLYGRRPRKKEVGEGRRDAMDPAANSVGGESGRRKKKRADSDSMEESGSTAGVGGHFPDPIMG